VSLAIGGFRIARIRAEVWLRDCLEVPQEEKR
jgi:hypothetical protein